MDQSLPKLINSAAARYRIAHSSWYVYFGEELETGS